MNTRVGVPEIGEQIGGRYDLVRVLGSGAAGVVFEAAHSYIGRRVALKWLYPHLAAEEVTKKRFFQEAQAACRINHPNVIDVLDGGKDRDSLFLAMELLKGEALSGRLERGILLPEPLIAILIPALRGVAAAHDAGIIHRDLKPENIFLAEPSGGQPGGTKVLDFGISKLTENRERLTNAGAFVGSPYYMAPEQIKDASTVDARVDIYAMGVILYEALSGQLPFEGETLTELFFRVTRESPPPIGQLVPSLDPELVTIIERAMATDPDDRFSDARSLAAALTPWDAAPTSERLRVDTDACPPPDPIADVPTIATAGADEMASVEAMLGEATVANASAPSSRHEEPSLGDTLMIDPPPAPPAPRAGGGRPESGPFTAARGPFLAEGKAELPPLPAFLKWTLLALAVSFVGASGAALWLFASLLN